MLVITHLTMGPCSLEIAVGLLPCSGTRDLILYRLNIVSRLLPRAEDYEITLHSSRNQIKLGPTLAKQNIVCSRQGCNFILMPSSVGRHKEDASLMKVFVV